MNQKFPWVILPASKEEEFMLAALKEAWKAFQLNEVPVGAVLVKEEKIIARGHNQVELLQDATAHAELLCLTTAEAALENWRLKGATLYCTMEPCAMCAGAMFLTRIDQLVWGAPDLRHGANGSWVDLFANKHPMHQIKITNGILQEYSAQLMRDFFRLQRQKKA